MKKVIYALLTLSLCFLIPLMSSCEIYDFYTQSDSPVIKNNSATEIISSDTQSKAMKLNKDLKIVALGDSITRGCALDNPETDRFTTKVADYLDGIYNNVEMTNYAVDGMTSDGLLQQLNNGKCDKLKNADIVMLCIGANNVLQFAEDLLYYDNTDIKAVFSSYGNFLLNNNSDMAAPKAVKKYFEKVTAYSKSKEFTSKIDSGLEGLRKNIPQIISSIRKVNANAKIYYANVYSPYKGMNFTLPYVEMMFPLGDISDENVKKIDNIISECQTANGYTIVDIYSLFAGSKDKNTNAGLDLSKLDLNYDPHPNKKGHLLITNEYIRVITEDYIK